jgi:hypothetical protein
LEEYLTNSINPYHIPGGRNMRRRFTWFSTFLTALWLLGCSHAPTPATKVAPQPAPQASATQGTPVAVVAETEFDFGLVEEGGEYVHDFKIGNKGDGVLEIKKVLPA